MVEQPDSRKRHHHIVLVAALNHKVIPHGTPGLCNVLHAALIRPFNVIRKGEKGVGAQRHIFVAAKPFPLFLSGKDRRLFLKALLPFPVP